MEECAWLCNSDSFLLVQMLCQRGSLVVKNTSTNSKKFPFAKEEYPLPCLGFIQLQGNTLVHFRCETKWVEYPLDVKRCASHDECFIASGWFPCGVILTMMWWLLQCIVGSGKFAIIASCIAIAWDLPARAIFCPQFGRVSSRLRTFVSSSRRFLWWIQRCPQRVWHFAL